MVEGHESRFLAKRVRGLGLLRVVVVVVCAAIGLHAQQPPDTPAVTVRGQTYTPRSILARNMGTAEDQTTAFPPHKVIDNIYYVGTRTISSFLITTPAGHFLINSTYERKRAGNRKVDLSRTRLSSSPDMKSSWARTPTEITGRRRSKMKELTGAEVVVMAEDMPALRDINRATGSIPLDRRSEDRRADGP